MLINQLLDVHDVTYYKALDESPLDKVMGKYKTRRCDNIKSASRVKVQKNENKNIPFNIDWITITSDTSDFLVKCFSFLKKASFERFHRM